MEQEQLSARQFADEVGIQPGTVSNIMNDRNKPSLEVMQKVLKRFPAISSDWLISDAGPMYRQKNDSQQPVLFDLPPVETNTSQPAAVRQSSNIPLRPTDSSLSAVDDSRPSIRRIRKVVIFFDDNTFQELSS